MQTPVEGLVSLYQPPGSLPLYYHPTSGLIVQGAIGPGIQGAIGQGIQGTIRPGIQGAIVPGIQGAIGPGIQGAIGQGIQGAIGPGIQGVIGSGIQGAIGQGIQAPILTTGNALGSVAGNENFGNASHVIASDASSATSREPSSDLQEPHSTTAAAEEDGGSTEEPEAADPQEIEACKEAIYKHPLFGLLSLLFEKCEQTTQTSQCSTSEELHRDLGAWVSAQEQEGRVFSTDDPSVDELMLKSVQVLRIHLLEIEKVRELCKDFCARYQARLKTTLQNEQLVHVSGLDGLDDTDDSSYQGQSQSSPSTVSVTTSLHSQILAAQVAAATGGSLVFQGDFMQGTPVAPAAPASMMTLGQGQVMSGGTIYQMVQTPQGLVAQPIQMPTMQPVFSSAPTLSMPTIIQAGAQMAHINLANAAAISSLQSNLFGQTMVNSQVFSYKDDESDSAHKLKRGVLPKRATQVMRSWLFQHLAHPYPTEDEKKQIASQTNLSLLQVNNWFINGRRRILQPMMDAATPPTDLSKAKKNKSSTRSAKRFWPDNIANLKSAALEDSLSSDGEEGDKSMEETEEETAIDGLGTYVPPQAVSTSNESCVGSTVVLSTVASNHSTAASNYSPAAPNHSAAASDPSAAALPVTPLRLFYTQPHQPTIELVPPSLGPACIPSTNEIAARTDQ